jgi:putative addiction module killer protein
MFEVQKAEEFDTWPSGLVDQRAQAKIVSRIERLGLGNPGDVKPVGGGISEMRVPYGPGYRVYFKQTDKTIVLLLCGGDKSTQQKDIKRAREIAAEL